MSQDMHAQIPKKDALEKELINQNKKNTRKNPDKLQQMRKRYFWNSERFVRLRESVVLNFLFCVFIPLVTLFTMEWIARGTFADNKQGTGFFQALQNHFSSFLIAYLLLLFIYIFISQLSGWHALATAIVCIIGNVPAVVTYYKLSMRGEPFLPWDLTQIDDLMGVKSNVALTLQPNMIATLLLFILLAFLAGFVRLPLKENGKSDWKARLIIAFATLVAGAGLVFGIFLSPAGTAAMGIKEDMWMQDRYYRNHGVITGFLTNLQILNISVPRGYGAEAVEEIVDETQRRSENETPYYAGSIAPGMATVENPDIIYVMAESFWDMTRLPGIEYDQPLLHNLENLKQEGAYGYVYSPSFGGGTCDVEFEALTGFSLENLPAGSKPFQQYVTEETFSLAWVLKERGYDTVAVHGYGRRFWQRDSAYPRLGINEFIASEDFVNPHIRRGFISDNAMVDRVIEEYEERRGTPTFIHAVTMQNHTTYSRDRYPEDERVKVLSAPASISDDVIGQLEDCATGIREMDAAMGKLTAYLQNSDRPTIVVFWGDHLNPMSDALGIFTKTGFIEEEDNSDPKLHQLPLLIWSNYNQTQVDLGTFSSYNISPVMMDLYGLEKPVFFEFLVQQMQVMHGRTRGVTINADNTFTQEPTEEQQAAANEHSILQYDYLFGQKQLEDYTS